MLESKPPLSKPVKTPIGRINSGCGRTPFGLLRCSVSFWDVNPGAFWVWVDWLLVIVAGRPAVGCARVDVEIEVLARVEERVEMVDSKSSAHFEVKETQTLETG